MMSGENEDSYVHFYIQLQNTQFAYKTLLSLQLLERRENGGTTHQRSVGGAIKTDWSLRLFRFLGGLKKSVNGFLSL